MGSSSQSHLNFILAKVVAITESKSVSLGLRRFETCQRGGFYFIGTTHIDIHSWMVPLADHPTGRSQVVIGVKIRSSWSGFETF
jgi:hypothetical protein